MVTPEEKLRAKVAGLESQVDLLETEITTLNDLLCNCGFSNGVESLKKALEEFCKRAESKNPFNS